MKKIFLITALILVSNVAFSATVGTKNITQADIVKYSCPQLNSFTSADINLNSFANRLYLRKCKNGQ